VSFALLKSIGQFTKFVVKLMPHMWLGAVSNGWPRPTWPVCLKNHPDSLVSKKKMAQDGKKIVDARFVRRRTSRCI
jgi:hypothetical protein